MNELFANARALWSDKRALAAFYGVWLAFLASVALFVTTREETLAQVFLTFALPVLSVALFFYLQAMCVCHVPGGAARELLRQAWRTWFKLLLASLPLVLVAVLMAYLSAKVDSLAMNFLCFAVLLPLLAMRLWLAVRRHGAWGAWQSPVAWLGNSFLSALPPYFGGLVFFALLPFLLLQARLSLFSGKLAVIWFALRVVLALALALFGWVTTVATLKGRPNAV